MVCFLCFFFKRVERFVTWERRKKCIKIHTGRMWRMWLVGSQNAGHGNFWPQKDEQDKAHVSDVSHGRERGILHEMGERRERRLGPLQGILNQSKISIFRWRTRVLTNLTTKKFFRQLSFSEPSERAKNRACWWMIFFQKTWITWVSSIWVGPLSF